jgi:hypothetical protein
MAGFSTHWNEKRVTLAVFFLLHQDLSFAHHWKPGSATLSTNKKAREM